MVISVGHSKKCPKLIDYKLKVIILYMKHFSQTDK
jgi:hypothetical protein